MNKPIEHSGTCRKSFFILVLLVHERTEMENLSAFP